MCNIILIKFRMETKFFYQNNFDLTFIFKVNC